MHIKYSLVIILAVQYLSLFQVKGQESVKDTVFINNSIHLKKNLQLQLAQPSLQFEMPELLLGVNDLQVILFNKNDAKLNLNQTIKYPNNLSVDSLLLPEYPGLSDYRNLGGTLGAFNITNKLTLDYGAFISAQYGYLFSSKQIVLGGNFLLRYAISNKLQLQTWGQYVTPGNSSDPTFTMRSVFPTSKLGTGLQYNSSDKSKVKVGVEYQYDLSDKTWKPESGGKMLFKF